MWLSVAELLLSVLYKDSCSHPAPPRHCHLARRAACSTAIKHPRNIELCLLSHLYMEKKKQIRGCRLGLQELPISVGFSASWGRVMLLARVFKHGLHSGEVGGLCDCYILHLFSVQCKCCAQFRLWCWVPTKYSFLRSPTWNNSIEGATWCGMKLVFNSPIQCPCCCAIVCMWVVISVMHGFTEKKSKTKRIKKNKKRKKILWVIFFLCVCFFWFFFLWLFKVGSNQQDVT